MFNFPGINLSENILSWSSELVPAYDFTELISGKIEPKYDWGTSADKFYSDVTFYVPVTSSSYIKEWFSLYSGVSIRMSADIDIFFPGVYHTSGVSVVPINLTYKGLHQDSRSKHSLWELRLYCYEEIPFINQITIPSFFGNGLWSETYVEKNAFQTGISRTGYYENFPGIQENYWDVSFPYLNRVQMNELIRWWLTRRTNTVLIQTELYRIREIVYETNGIYYSANVTLYK